VGYWKQWSEDGYKSIGERSNLAYYMGKRKLNIGCGPAPEPRWNGWINVDINPRSWANVICDLRDDWPFRDQVFDTAFAYLTFQMFSHGEEIFHVIAEAWRVLRIGGYLVSAVPMGFVGNPMQKSFWNTATPGMMVKDSYWKSEMSTTCWDQCLPVKPWEIKAVDVKDGLLWFAFRRLE